MSIVSTVETDAKAVGSTVKTALGADVMPMASAFETSVFKFLTYKINIFGAKIPVSKALVKYGAVVVLALGLFGTQAYLYVQHTETAQHTATLESLAKQTDTSFVNVNSAIIATNKIVGAVSTAQQADAAKITALTARVAADETKLTPVRPTSAVTKKYFRKK